jgi:hypothetical protein
MKLMFIMVMSMVAINAYWELTLEQKIVQRESSLVTIARGTLNVSLLTKQEAVGILYDCWKFKTYFVTRYWIDYCLQRDVKDCMSANESRQVSQLVAAAPTDTLAMSVLLYYPSQLYQQFVCVNLSNLSQSYLPNLTGNMLLSYMFNDSLNTTWNCSWAVKEYTPFVVYNSTNVAHVSSTKCASDAIMWEQYCRMMEANAGDRIDCDNVLPINKRMVLNNMKNAQRCVS